MSMSFEDEGSFKDISDLAILMDQHVDQFVFEDIVKTYIWKIRYGSRRRARAGRGRYYGGGGHCPETLYLVLMKELRLDGTARKINNGLRSISSTHNLYCSY
jgi:hypothetical protein